MYLRQKYLAFVCIFCISALACQRDFFCPTPLAWETSSPRDMAKIGVLYIENGSWRGTQLLAAAWVSESMQIRVLLKSGYSYGCQWWGTSAWVLNQETSIPFAWGWGGQFIFIIPALEMVVVSTAGDDEEQIEGALKFVRQLLAEAVLS